MNLFAISCAYSTMSDHPTDLELELFRTGEALEITVKHVADCEQCRQRSAFFIALAAEQQLCDLSIEIPVETDNKITAMARQQAVQVRDQARAQRLKRWVSSIAGVAAVIFIVLVVPVMHQDDRPQLINAEADVNGDCRVDILDALALARIAATTTEERWDLNRDGRIDTSDVDFIAHEAVSLGDSS